MVTLFLLLNLVLVTLTLWGRLEVKRFLAAYPVIDDATAVDAFKTLARRNMVGALVFLPLGIGSVLFAVYLVSQLQLVGLAIALAVQIPSFLLGRNLLRLERQARELECADEELQDMHRKIGHSWVKKALPDF